MIKFLKFLPALLLTQPATAQDVRGQIDGTLQGYASQWFVTASDEGGQSDWSGDESYAIVAILGHRAANTVLDTEGALALTFEMIPEAGGYNVLGREIAYYRQPEILYLSQGDSAEIQVTEATFDGGQLHVTGKFAGTLGATDDFGETFSVDDARIVAGTFEATLLVME